MSNRKLDDQHPRGDGYAPELAALRRELRDFISRIPGVGARRRRLGNVPRGHRTIPMDFFRQLVSVSKIRPMLVAAADLDVPALSARLAYHDELARLRTDAQNLLGTIESTLDANRAEMAAAALPAYAVAKALAYRDPSRPDVAALRRAMRRAGRAGRKKAKK